MTSAIVIGGGIAGCSTAHALVKRGIAVTLIERHEKLAQEASGNPVGMLFPKFSVKPNLTDQLTLIGFTFTLSLLKVLPVKGPIFDACGLLQLAYDTREQTKQQTLIQLSEYQQLIQPVTATEASKLAGIALNLGGLYMPQAGWVKPVAFCEALCDSPLITKITSTEALKIQRIQNCWGVFIHKNQLVESDIVVICNANDVKQFSQYTSAKITQVRGQINFITENSTSKSLKTIVCSNHFVSPAVDGFHTIGTSYAPNDANPKLSESDTHENLQALRKISTQIYENIDQKSAQGRVAWRSATLDYMPLAGQLLDEDLIRANPPRYNANPADLPWLRGLYINAGHGSKGMITAPICGELITHLASNEALGVDAKLASKLNPSRFLLRELGLKQLSQSLYG